MRWIRLAVVGVLLTLVGTESRADATVQSLTGLAQRTFSDQTFDQDCHDDVNDPDFMLAVPGASSSATLTIEGNDVTLECNGRCTPAEAGDDVVGVISLFNVVLVLTEPSHVSVTGKLSRQPGGRAVASASYGNVVVRLGDETTTPEAPLDEPLDIPAGPFVVFLDADATGTASASFDVTIRIVPATSRWKSAKSGSFATASNWDPASVPTEIGAAVFDATGRGYTVSLGEFRDVAQLDVTAGSPTLVSADSLPAGLDALGESPDDYAVEINGSARLTLGARFRLTGREISIGGDEAAPPRLVVAGDPVVTGNETSTLFVHNEIDVGGEAFAGELLVTSGIAFAGTTRVGTLPPSGGGGSSLRESEISVSGAGSRFHTGELTFEGACGFVVERGAFVDSGAVTFLPTAQGFFDVDGSGSNGPSEWRVSSFEGVAPGAGSQIVGVSDGGALTVTLGPTFVPKGMTVLVNSLRKGRSSFQADGELDVEGELVVFRSDAVLDGDVNVSSGKILVDGGVMVVSEKGSGDVVVGAAGKSALVEVSAGGVIDTKTNGRAWRIGSAPGSNGRVVLGSLGIDDRATFESHGLIELGNADGTGTGSLFKSGGSTVSTTTAKILVHVGSDYAGFNGQIPFLLAPKAPTRGKAAKAPVPSVARCTEFVNNGTVIAGGMRIEGAYTQSATGETIVEIAGPGSPTGEEALVVTGAATLDGKLVLQFAKGFAPSVGDAFGVIGVNGAGSSGTFSQVEVRGLEPGAQFSTAVTGGRLTATTTVAAAALPSVSVKAKGRKVAEKKTKKPAVFTFTRTGATTAPLDVTYQLAGSATSGDDYAAPSGTVTIPVGKNSVTLNVQMVNDTLPEQPESLEVRVVPNAGSTRGKKPTASLVIADDDRVRR